MDRTRPKKRGIFFRTITNELSGGEIDGCVAENINRIDIGVGTFIVPNDRASYSGNIVLVSSSSNVQNGMSVCNGNFSILAWRTKSLDAKSHLSHASISALAQDVSFFRGDKENLSARLVSGSVQVEVSADLVGIESIEVDDGDGIGSPKDISRVEIKLRTTIDSGDVVFLVPRCDDYFVPTADTSVETEKEVFFGSKDSDVSSGLEGATPEVEVS